jgi:hypothetical protein
MVDCAVGGGLPALDDIDPKGSIGGMERHLTDKTKPMVKPAVMVCTLIIGHATRSLGLSHLLEQKCVVPLLHSQNVMHVMLVKRLHMRGIRTQAVFGDDHLEVGVIPAKLGDETLGGVALAIIFLGAVLFDNGLRHAGNDFALIGVDERGTQQLMGRGDGAIAVVFFQARVAVHLCGGKRARAIEGEKVVPLDQDHLFQGFATLKLAKNRPEGGSQVVGLDGIAYLAHRGLTWHPSNAVNALYIVLGAFFVTGEQRGGFEGEQGKGGHEGITQWDPGIAFAMLRKLTKDVLNRAQQGISTEMSSHFGHHEAHSPPNRKWTYGCHESHILAWRFTKRQVGMPDEYWLLQASGNCCSCCAYPRKDGPSLRRRGIRMVEQSH